MSELYGPFNFFEEIEGDVYNDLTDEIIEFYGIPFYYIPRNYINEDTLLGENDVSTFTTKFLLKMFVKDVNAFAGQGDIYSKFGLYSMDECTLEISKRKFQEATGMEKPLIGDILFFNWTYTKTIYEINFVETENPFYHLGETPKYELIIKRWQYSHEEFTADNDLKDIITNVENNEDFLSDNDDLITSGESLIED